MKSGGLESLGDENANRTDSISGTSHVIEFCEIYCLTVCTGGP